MKSPALIATAAFALGGVGFALAQLLLARALPATDFAVVSLILAINQVGFSAGTLGIEVPINRHQIPASRTLLLRTLWIAAPIAAVCGLVSVYGYTVGPVFGFLVFLMITASSANTVAASLYRSTRQFVPGLMLTQLQNYALLAIAGVALLIPSATAAGVTGMIALAYVVGAGIGWTTLRRRDADAPEVAPSRSFVAEGLFALGYSIASMIMSQFERLIIPRMLTMTDVAVFSVASALAASPFRMLQIGVGFTLTPRLRACRDIAQIRSLLLKEASLAAAATAALIAGVCVLAPLILRVSLRGRYQLGNALLFAIFSVGIVRVISAFAVSCVQALGQSAEFRKLTFWSWCSLAISLGCASVVGRFGLPGIVYGVGAGWLSLMLAALILALKVIRSARESFMAPRTT